jgi:hypothetical protein
MRIEMNTIVRPLAVAVAAALASTVAPAADWELNPRVEAGYLIDDNYRLALPGNEIEVQGPLADAQLEMRALTQQGEFSFTPRVRATYFPDEQDLDTIDYFASLNWEHRGQRVEGRVRGEFSQEDVVNSEQPDAKCRATPASVTRTLATRDGCWSTTPAPGCRCGRPSAST